MDKIKEKNKEDVIKAVVEQYVEKSSREVRFKEVLKDIIELELKGNELMMSM